MPDSVSLSSLLGPALGVIAAYFVLLAIAYRLGSGTAFAKAFLKSSTPPAVAAVLLFIAVYLIVLTISAQVATNSGDFAYSVASATFGLALGWVLGIVISPSSKDEASEFSLLTKAVSTFLTGYVLGYIKDLKLPQIQAFLDRPGIPFRLMAGGACGLAALAAVFVIRRAEVMQTNAAREWFISFAPPDPKHAQALRADVLARGPFSSRDDAMAEIERIKILDEFKGVTLTAVRVDILSEEPIAATRRMKVQSRFLSRHQLARLQRPEQLSRRQRSLRPILHPVPNSRSVSRSRVPHTFAVFECVGLLRPHVLAIPFTLEVPSCPNQFASSEPVSPDRKLRGNALAADCKLICTRCVPFARHPRIRRRTSPSWCAPIR